MFSNTQNNFQLIINTENNKDMDNTEFNKSNFEDINIFEQNKNDYQYLFDFDKFDEELFLNKENQKENKSTFQKETSIINYISNNKDNNNNKSFSTFEKVDSIKTKESLNIHKKRKREYLNNTSDDIYGPNYKIENDKVIRLKKILSKEERKEISIIRNRISARKSRQKKKDEVLYLKNIIYNLLNVIENQNNSISYCPNCNQYIINFSELEKRIYKDNNNVNNSNDKVNIQTNYIATDEKTQIGIEQNNEIRYSSFINKILAILLGVICIIIFIGIPVKNTTFDIQNNNQVTLNDNKFNIKEYRYLENSNDKIYYKDYNNSLMIINSNNFSFTMENYYSIQQKDLYKFKRIAVNNLISLINKNNLNQNRNINSFNSFNNIENKNINNYPKKYKIKGFLQERNNEINNISSLAIYSYENYPTCIVNSTNHITYNYYNNYDLNLPLIDDQEFFDAISKVVYSFELKENGYNFINYFNNISDFENLFIKGSRNKNQCIYFQVLIPHKINGIQSYYELILKPIQINTIFK